LAGIGTSVKNFPAPILSIKSRQDKANPNGLYEIYTLTTWMLEIPCGITDIRISM
jgi:hypothetical protein